MGKAIIVPGADFSGLGMGKVTFSGTINAPKVIVGQTYTLTAMSDATWDIDDDTYADINSSTGVLTIKSGAWGNEVTVTATAGGESASATIKVFYSTVESGTFEDAEIVDVSTILRNGSTGNPSNAYRVSISKTIAVSSYREVLVKTTKKPETGYQLHAELSLYTDSPNTTTSNSNNTICEYGVEATNTGLYPSGKFLPLYEDLENAYYVEKAAAGYTPISFGITFDESTDGTYGNDRVIRANDFSGKTTLVALFK